MAVASTQSTTPLSVRSWCAATIAVACVLVAASSARAGGLVIARVRTPYPLLSAYHGYAVWSEEDADGVYRLTVWHGGVERRLPFGARDVPFDAAAGPDHRGLPGVVFSRCQQDPPFDTTSAPRVPDWLLARGCRLWEIDLPDGRAYPLRAFGGPGVSDETPAIWRGAIAFAQLRAGASPERLFIRRADGMQRGLAGGTQPNGWALQLSLSESQLAFEWVVAAPSGAGISDATELRLDSAAGGPSKLIAGGDVSGACGFYADLSPSLDDNSLLYVDQDFDCDGPPDVGGGEEANSYLEQTRARHSFRSATQAPALLDGLAWDGSQAFWILQRGSDLFASPGTCETDRCTLLRGPLPRLSRDPRH